MAHDILAPWAEVVPGVGPMTVDQMLELPRDEWMYELVWRGGSSACRQEAAKHRPSRRNW